MISGGSPTAGLEEEIAEWAIVTKTGGGRRNIINAQLEAEEEK